MTTTDNLSSDTVVGTVTVSRPITFEFATGVLCTALEGGIGYWSQPHDIVRQTVPESVDSLGWVYDSYILDIEEIGEGTEFPEAVRYQGRKHQAQVDLNTVVRGISTILAEPHGVVHLHPGNAAIVANAVAENDGGMIDSDAADWIIQAGLFGEVVFG